MFGYHKITTASFKNEPFDNKYPYGFYTRQHCFLSVKIKEALQVIKKLSCRSKTN